jgi:hypothetical protein
MKTAAQALADLQAFIGQPLPGTPTPTQKKEYETFQRDATEIAKQLAEQITDADPAPQPKPAQAAQNQQKRIQQVLRGYQLLLDDATTSETKRINTLIRALQLLLED